MVDKWERNMTEKEISSALEKVAREVGTGHITADKFHLARDREVCVMLD